NGSSPNAAVAIDALGNVYGTAFQAGNGYGTVFKVAAGTNSVTAIATFDGLNGQYPEARLIADPNGNLYGTTLEGGLYGYGTVFEIGAGNHVLTTLANFDGTNGSLPRHGLLADSNGNFYGVTTSGGANDLGTVFQIAASTHSITTLATFDGTHGANPV